VTEPNEFDEFRRRVARGERRRRILVTAPRGLTITVERIRITDDGKKAIEG
jgi:hypothetical protein